MIIIAAIRSLIIIIVVIIIFIIIIICQLDQHSKSEENFPTKCNGFVSLSMDSGTDSQKRVTIVQRGRCDPHIGTMVTHACIIMSFFASGQFE